MVKSIGNSFEAREKKNKKRSSIVKMSDLRVENLMEEIKVEATDKSVDSIILASNEELLNVADEFKEVESITALNNLEDNASLEVNNFDLNINNDEFFNLNVKNDSFEGKITTVRVYDDILEILKKYATMKNYPIIEFTNKLITLGLDDIKDFGMLQISEIKLKNNTSRSIMYNLTDNMEETLNKYIKDMNKLGYKISRNVILNVILNETLKKFYTK